MKHPVVTVGIKRRKEPNFGPFEMIFKASKERPLKPIVQVSN